jgi:hypothetical protein
MAMGTTVFRIRIELIFPRCWNLVTLSRSCSAASFHPGRPPSQPRAVSQEQHGGDCREKCPEHVAPRRPFLAADPADAVSLRRRH